ncbi:Hydroperoxide lyase 1 isoform 3 [Theobroma cacao]|uniref:Hydroperoxide lyase 1 isoform 3 n=1 Tax=Theobroma cacao TaxID=3641 RepID=A0A061DKR9_THECC|nr:Hydroperoxide lyase 1 isoform 3 [Theobroma cacao]
MAMATMMMSRMMGMSPPPVPPPPPPPSSSSSPLATQALSAPSSRPPTNLPTRTIPGSYGWPLLGPISDRLDYFWFQGPDTFFRILLLIFHVFMESHDTTSFDLGQLKNFAMDILKRGSKVWVTELLGNLDKFLDTIESEISTNGSSSYIPHLQSMLFNFLAKSILGADPTIDPDIANSAPFTLNLWLGLQLLPTISVRVIQPLEEIFLHSYTYPHALVSGGYQKLYHFIERHGQEVVQRGEIDFGLSAADAIHNLIFVLGFNAFGGFSIFLPTLFAAIASDKTGLQARLREEVRKMNGSSTRLSFDSLKEMELVNSVVYETLRLNPPVALQYARARKDFQLASHDSVFDIKEGELLCGYQPLAMRDGKVFDEPESFKPDRFVGKGKELLSNLFWSNGPQTGSPSESNKQCAGKDYVTLSASLIVAHMFQRYDSFSGDSSKITAVETTK